MSQTKHEIQAILASANTEPRHRFGQNFMIDQNLVRIVADAGELSRVDTVIEVGPGTGTLTEELLARAGKVIAIEIDRDLAGALRDRFGSDERFQLIEGDALAGKHDLNEELSKLLMARQPATSSRDKFKLVANLPYNIASPLIIDLLIAGVDLLAFTVQKEVADRLRASPDSDAYGPLTVTVQTLASVELLRTLPPQAFWPAPKIESALVQIRRHDCPIDNAREFGAFVQQIFSFRRKTLRKALNQAGFEGDLVLKSIEIDPQLRPENLSKEQFRQLFDASRSPKS
jgi:16S rRNA (adenine1518-N6/adenine1519-N6)-dimethyltransferase